MSCLYVVLAAVAVIVFVFWWVEAPRWVKDKVAHVALGALVSEAELRKRAAETAPSIDLGNLQKVVPAGVPMPPEVSQALGPAAIFQWSTIAAWGLYALLEEKGEAALPRLRRDVTLLYDHCYHPMAMETLCRLAQRGIGRVETIALFEKALTTLDGRIILPTLTALAALGPASPGIVAGFKHWIDLSSDRDTDKLEMVCLLAACSPEAARGYVHYLERWVSGAITAGDVPVASTMVSEIDGQKVAMSVLADGTVIEERDGQRIVKEAGRSIGRSDAEWIALAARCLAQLPR